jgi:hypothetical protein
VRRVPVSTPSQLTVVTLGGGTVAPLADPGAPAHDPIPKQSRTDGSCMASATWSTP